MLKVALVVAASLVLLAPVASAEYIPPPTGWCTGYETHGSTGGYECVGIYGQDGGCIGVYHTHPNPNHPDGCTGL